jgi:hypothetical protein
MSWVQNTDLLQKSVNILVCTISSDSMACVVSSALSIWGMGGGEGHYEIVIYFWDIFTNKQKCGENLQDLVIVDKLLDGTVRKKIEMAVRYVPLI